MEIVWVVVRVLAFIGLIVWLVDIVRGKEQLRDARGRLRPGYAAAVSVAALFVLGLVGTAIAEAV
jgi:hypothetical protein